MSEVKLNLVEDIDDVINPGDAIVVETRESENEPYHLDIIHCCVLCGERTTTARGKRHDYNPETKSLTPSIIHDKDLGGCGWHGYLTNGIFKQC